MVDLRERCMQAYDAIDYNTSVSLFRTIDSYYDEGKNAHHAINDLIAFERSILEYESMHEYRRLPFHLKLLDLAKRIKLLFASR